MTEKKVQTKNKFGETLIGIETRPDTNLEKYPTIILVHGFGVSKEQKGMFDELAKQYAIAGFLTYRFDFSGVGESEGDFTETSLTKQSQDLESILEYVKNQMIVDISRIAIHAQSFGTCVVISLRPMVKTIILMGAIAHPKNMLSQYFASEYNPDGVSKFTRSDGTFTIVKPHFWKNLDEFNLPELMKKIDSPKLFIHAELDETIPRSEMETLYNMSQGIKEKVIISGANHKMMPGVEKMHIIAVDWLTTYLV